MLHAHRWFAALAVTCLAFSACGTPEQDPQDAASNDATDVSDATDTTGETVLPGDGVWLAFQVDDSANQTFGDGDMKWTGSFAWDETTNEIVPADSWLPSDGPYPLLYDDGPLSAGGHEKEGAVKGDHIFSTQVKFKAATDTTFEYGVLNEFDNWMWVGPNGKLVVPAGATGVIDAPGQTLKKFGTIDMKVTLDTQTLHPNFALWKPATHKFYLKGSMNQWTPVQLLDDGQKGDAVADDGIYTYVHLLNLGKHDGGLPAGDEVQFMFVATQGDALPEEGQEYKGAMKANAEGVEAWTGTGAGGAWESAAVLFAKDSKGKFENTAIVVPGGAACDPACKETEACVSGKCVAIAGCVPACEGGLQCVEGKCVDPNACDPACTQGWNCVGGTCVDPNACDPACGDGQVCNAGKCEDKVCDPVCGEGQQCVKGACEDKPCDPACGEGQQCVKGACQDLPCEPACSDGFQCNKGKCEAIPCDPACKDTEECVGGKCVLVGPATLTAVTPGWAPAKGGGMVVLKGDNLKPWHKVTFTSTNPSATSGVGTDATVVAGQGLSVTVPGLPVGWADVTVVVPGQSTLKLAGALELLAFESPQLDGNLNDWDATSLAGASTVVTDWGADKNELTTLQAAFDDQNVYFGIQGVCEAGNAIVVYVDVDPGKTTGPKSPALLKDQAGAVDDAISNLLVGANTSNGFEFAFATIGMAGFDGGDAGQSTGAGWRGLGNLEDFSWLAFPVKAHFANKVIEASIPIATLFPNGVPAGGADLQFFAALVSKDGNSNSNQFLPTQISPPDGKTVTTLATLRVRK